MRKEVKILKRDYRKYAKWIKHLHLVQGVAARHLGVPDIDKPPFPVLSFKGWIRREIAHNTRYGVLAQKVGYVR